MNHDVIDFSTDVIARSQTVPVLVDFWAAWCGPCKMLSPILERLAAEADGRWVLVKVDTETNGELAARFGIRGIPDLKLFHRGQVIAELTGALPEPQLRDWIRQHLPTPKRETMSRARQLILAGRASEAAALLKPLAGADRADDELVVLTARALVFDHPAMATKMISSLPGHSPWHDDATNVLILAQALLHVEDGRTDTPLRSTYLKGLRALGTQDFATAAAALTDVLLESPNFDDGRARATCLALFKHVGLRHPVAEQYYRRFSMAVNA